MRRAQQQEVAQPVKTLRQACIERGIDPDNTGVKSTKQRWLNVDRIIPGVADKQAAFLSNQRDANGYRLRRANARKMYTRTSAANDAAMIAQSDMPVACYVAAFCRLNNLVQS
jgi:hypothetical protein